jgi:hypothetical protein
MAAFRCAGVTRAVPLGSTESSSANLTFLDAGTGADDAR